ncbi:MAG: hypothetical protein PHI55_10665 [Burkholderiaceae bacterium]|nr:hypothetical protein [Burkholderiaceae bacterium]
MPIQEIEISTKNKRVFSVHLEKWAQSHFECKLAAINLGPQLPADATFGPFTKGTTALTAYQALVAGLCSALAKLDATDSIAVVNNPCNTEFVTAPEQQKVLGHGVVVKVNGVNA